MTDTVDVDLTEHTRIVTEFLDGLVDAFDLEGRVEAVSIDDDTSEDEDLDEDLLEDDEPAAPQADGTPPVDYALVREELAEFLPSVGVKVTQGETFFVEPKLTEEKPE